MLYAPTWEGWDGDPGNTSVIAAGENLVRALLADPGVRLLYKPHPLTGSVDPRAGAADRRVRELIRAANRARSGPRPAPSKELAARTAELDRLTAAEFREGADQAERMLVQSTPPPGRAEAVARATRAWEAAYWASLPEGEHQVVVDARPSLYSCFDAADLLISDVSSVISDFLASGKPYAVANTGGMSEAEFRAAFPTVAAAVILTPDASGCRPCWRRSATRRRTDWRRRAGGVEGPAAGPGGALVPGAVRGGGAGAGARKRGQRVERQARDGAGAPATGAGAPSGGAAGAAARAGAAHRVPGRGGPVRDADAGVTVRAGRRPGPDAARAWCREVRRARRSSGTGSTTPGSRGRRSARTPGARGRCPRRSGRRSRSRGAS